uniref:Uncharacterized protein n=1 Tax=viral metagenome TaxID=1070528 RepID=A0A6M3IIJ9_9ZZZZ
MTDATLLKGLANQDAPQAGSENSEVFTKFTKRGELCIVDFLQEMALEGRIYQVRAGTVTTGLTGDVEITDAAAEMCADAGSGVTIMPCYANIHVEALGGTVPIIAIKSVATVSSAGAAFVPLNLLLDGITAALAARATARVAGAGGVTVTAELATTTRRHYSATLATVDMIFEWKPAYTPTLKNGACIYVQVAGTTAGPNYYASLDFAELPSVNVE